MEFTAENQKNSNIFTQNINVQDMYTAELAAQSGSGEKLNNITRIISM